MDYQRGRGDSTPGAAVLFGSEGVDFGGSGGDGALGDAVGSVVMVVVEHADAVPVDRGTVWVRRGDGKTQRCSPVDTEVVGDCYPNGITPVRHNVGTRESV